ncbi:MAG: AAA family ATPase [Phycisphaeraceae bacterium]|nr:AAA family ATPase [Phycisphaeraceae bacterium]
MTTLLSPSDRCACIAKRIEDQVGSHRYSMWFTSTRLNIDGGKRLRVEVPSAFVADWIGRNFTEQLQCAAADELGEQAEVELRVNAEVGEDGRDQAVAVTEAHDAGTPRNGTPKTSAAKLRGEARPSENGRNGHALPLRYRLEHFVVGKCNELAHAAACRAAEPGRLTGETIFFHGLCGVGKTHLLQGICARMLEHKPDAHVLYTTGEQFTNEYIQAIRFQKLDAFRRRIRRLDLLAIDDVHFLAGREKTQQEFLHSFDALELAGSRLIMASDHHPRLVEPFGEALISRCLRGLVIEVKPPDQPTRRRIITQLAQRRNLELRDGVGDLLVSHYQGSVREMEGALTKLEALAMLQADSTHNGDGRRVIGQVLVRQLLESPQQVGRSRPIRPEQVLRTVSDLFGIAREQILGNRRQAQIVLARSLVMYLLRKLTHLSYPEIARFMKRPGHSGVLTAVARMEERIKDKGLEKLQLAAPHEPAPLLEVIDRITYQIQRES